MAAAPQPPDVRVLENEWPPPEGSRGSRVPEAKRDIPAKVRRREEKESRKKWRT